jgi:hypothetical protein
MPKTLNIISRSDTTTNWFQTNAYSDNDINTIHDPEGAVATKAITSIPSPFARIDLFKSAFNFLENKATNNIAELDGNTINHRLVSEALDMAQLFFNLDTLKEGDSHLRILAWDRAAQLQKLKTSGNQKHLILAETLELFLEQDKTAYNYDRWGTVFMLSYDYKIIGGTSPSTLFFTTGNEIYPRVNIKFGNDTLFDAEFLPLYKREFEFQKYLHLLFKAHSAQLGDAMKEMKDYLNLNLKRLEAHNPQQYRSLQTALSAFSLEIFEKEYQLLDTGTTGSVVSVMGVPLRKRLVDKGAIGKTSDFVIKSTKNTADLPPLVLQNGFNKTGMLYANGGTWDGAAVRVPFADAAPMEKRQLPGQNEIYPYLTVDDFLEPYLLKLIYPLNHEKYFNGNWRGNAQESFLLPIKAEYFKYFDVKTLKETIGNLPVFQMEPRVGGGVAATLRIPIQKEGEFITLERLYYPSASANEQRKPNIGTTSNEGAIMECRFGAAVAPFVRTTDTNQYRVALVDADALAHNIGNEYSINFYKNDSQTPLTTRQKQRSDKRMREGATSKFYVVESAFDAMEIANGVGKGLLIPDFKPHNGTAQFKFAVDFGTSNSHIEYTKDNDRHPKPFEITQNEVLFAATYRNDQFFDLSPEIKQLILHEFLPDAIGKDSEFSFPIQTAISEHINYNHAQKPDSLADHNIPFYYGKQVRRPNAQIATNLKWANYALEQADQNRVDMFLETLAFMMRCKVLSNGGDPARTEIVWFYPSSMAPQRRSKLQSLWRENFAQYLAPVRDEAVGRNSNLRSISESLAPYYHYAAAEGVSSAAAPALFIDIGGGTTDVVVFNANKPIFLTSFRFAGNAIFGDGWNGSANTNGFVAKYRPKVEKILSENASLGQTRELLDLMNGFGRDSSEYISFFFSLERNKRLMDSRVPINLSQWLSEDEDLKMVLLTFHAATIYHIAKLMLKANLPMPRYVCYGGNGSKINSEIDADPSLRYLSQFTKLMFEAVYTQAYGGANQTENLTLKKSNEPKEITCKGGLYEAADTAVEDIMVVLMGDTAQTIANETPVGQFPRNQVRYNQLQAEQYDSVCAEVRTFLDVFFNLNNEYSFNRNFGINAAKMDFFKTTLQQDLKQYLLEGLHKKSIENADTNAVIEESLFFYPLVGALNNLASRTVLG